MAASQTVLKIQNKTTKDTRAFQQIHSITTHRVRKAEHFQTGFLKKKSVTSFTLRRVLALILVRATTEPRRAKVIKIKKYIFFFLSITCTHPKPEEGRKQNRLVLFIFFLLLLEVSQIIVLRTLVSVLRFSHCPSHWHRWPGLPNLIAIRSNNIKANKTNFCLSGGLNLYQCMEKNTSCLCADFTGKNWII